MRGDAADPIGGTDATSGASRIRAAFERANGDGRAAVIAYIVAGYPDQEASFDVALGAIDAGADILEVGFPYSDPLADGTTLQRASAVALSAGTTRESAIALVKR